MKRKILAVLISTAIVSTVCGCGSKKNEEPVTDTLVIENNTDEYDTVDAETEDDSYENINDCSNCVSGKDACDEGCGGGGDEDGLVRKEYVPDYSYDSEKDYGINMDLLFASAEAKESDSTYQSLKEKFPKESCNLCYVEYSVNSGEDVILACNDIKAIDVLYAFLEGEVTYFNEEDTTTDINGAIYHNYYIESDKIATPAHISYDDIYGNAVTLFYQDMTTLDYYCWTFIYENESETIMHNTIDYEEYGGCGC